jgi:hypothetical protein
VVGIITDRDICLSLASQHGSAFRSGTSWFFKSTK